MMGKEVELYFPNAPEQCQSCPALSAAASRLAMLYGASAALDSRNSAHENLDDDTKITEDAQSTVDASIVMTNVTIEQQRSLEILAAKLTGDCDEGVVNGSFKRPISGIAGIRNELVTNTRICGSNADEAAFFPPEMYSSVQKKQ